MATELPLSGVAPVPELAADVASTDYLQTRGWLYADHFALGRAGEATFADEMALWREALAGQGFYERRRLTLEDVVLTDWVPRSPGRYHTRQAQRAREEAKHRIAERRGDHVVYDPHGKTSMVQGGIGCLRLAMKDIGGTKVKFLGATTGGVVHRGFVVALDLEQYGAIADDVDKRGGIRCTLAGTLRFWTPAQKLDLFMTEDVPRLYLGVDELRKGTRPANDLPPLDVTPAVTFAVNGAEYFTYSHFAPGDQGHVSRAVEWMTRYVGERYHGRMLTDFDELVPRFADTAAPLTILMNPEAPFDEIGGALARHLSERSFTIINYNIETVAMGGDTYNVTGNVGAVGPGATGTVNIQQIDLSDLAAELGRLRLALRERGAGAEHDIAMGEVAKAEQAANEGNRDGALRHLKQAGRWALDVATQIGVPVATEALKSVLR